MAEPSTMRPGRIPALVGGSTAAGPAETDAPRTSGAFTTRRDRVRYVLVVAVLAVVAVLSTAGILLWGNEAEPGSRAFWMIAGMRLDSLGVIAIVALCHSFATVSFHTVTGNRIITPSIMGFEALYTAVQTGAVYVLGAAGIGVVTGTGPFLAQAALMVVLATVLYSWLLSRPYGSIHLMLLVGVVLGGGLAALSTFMQRLLDPNSFDVLSARLFGNISNARSEYVAIAAPIVVVVCLVLWLRSRRMNVLALGADSATNLGLHHRRELMVTLLLVSVLMAMTTALVGPMTFLGFLVATLAYSLVDTHDHRMVLPVAALGAYAVLTLAYFVLRHVFYAGGAVTVIIELVGGITFLIVVMRKGRL